MNNCSIHVLFFLYGIGFLCFSFGVMVLAWGALMVADAWRDYAKNKS